MNRITLGLATPFLSLPVVPDIFTPARPPFEPLFFVEIAGPIGFYTAGTVNKSNEIP